MNAIRFDDSGPAGPSQPPLGSSHGQAALLLTESLMHALVDKGTLSREDFVEIVEGAAEVEVELGAAKAAVPANRDGSLLQPLADAFRSELG